MFASLVRCDAIKALGVHVALAASVACCDVVRALGAHVAIAIGLARDGAIEPAWRVVMYEHLVPTLQLP